MSHIDISELPSAPTKTFVESHWMVLSPVFQWAPRPPPPRRRICPAPDRRPADRGNARPEAPEKPSHRAIRTVSPTKNRGDLPQPSWKKRAFWWWGYTNKMIHSSLVSGDELTDVPTVDHRFSGIGRPWGRQKYPEWGYWPVILWSDHLPGSSVNPPPRRKLWIKMGKSTGIIIALPRMENEARSPRTLPKQRTIR